MIRSEQATEIKSFYSSIFTHPFTNHIFMKEPNDQGYSSLSTILPLAYAQQDFAISKNEELLAFIRLKNGIQSIDLLNTDQKNSIIDTWGTLVSQLKSISSINSNILEADSLGDSIQAFTHIKPYLLPSTCTEKPWLADLLEKIGFVPELDFYIIIKQKLTSAKVHPVKSFLKKLLPGTFRVDFRKLNENERNEELDLLKQKINIVQNILKGIEIDSSQISPSYFKKFLPQNILEDSTKYLKIDNQKYTKTYRMHIAPEEGDLNFWLKDIYALLKGEAYLSIQWVNRSSNDDKAKAENKIQLLSQLKAAKASTNTLLKENKAIIEELLSKPYSYDLIFHITIIADSLGELQKIENLIRRPIRNAIFSPLDRLQVKNYLASLPFANDLLHDKEKNFATISFAKACFPFLKTTLGTASGPLMGLLNENHRPVFINEYDRSIFNNRHINFIGDSGSGKTVAAKLAIHRRMSSDASFVIVDSTQDGWKFFLDFHGGKLIDIDTENKSEAYFAPLLIPEDYCLQEFNFHLEKTVRLLSMLNKDADISSPIEESFLYESLREIYSSNLKLCFSDLYKFWSKPSALLMKNFPLDFFEKWRNIISPFCNCSNGIYAGLMDTCNPIVKNAEKLILFTFTKVDNNSALLAIALHLVANYIEQRVVINKETKLTFVVDEAWKIFTGKYGSKGKELMSYFARAGRGMDLGLWTISQKPRDLPKEVHSSASSSLVFQLKESLDREEISSCVDLSVVESKHLECPEIFEPGSCFFKATKCSGLINIVMSDSESVLTNSTRDFVNKREEVFNNFYKKLLCGDSKEYADYLLRKQAAEQTVKELACEV